MRGRTSDHLVEPGQLRQILGRAKLPAISHWIRTQIDAGEKVIIAAHHRDVVDAYANPVRRPQNPGRTKKEADIGYVTPADEHTGPAASRSRKARLAHRPSESET